MTEPNVEGPAELGASVLGFASYCAVGALVALGYGIVALRNAPDVHAGAWLSVVSVVGIAAGAVLYRTRSWHYLSRPLAVVRWAIAGLVAGGTGGALSMATGMAGPAGILVGAAVGSIVLLSCGLYWHQDVMLASDESRSLIQVAQTWLSIFTVALVLGLVAWLV